jgi:DNA-binding NtrC family response regulator
MPMTKVLIIEDNVDLSNLFQMALGLDSISAAVCRDGRDAIEIIKKLKPKVILLDMHLPHVSGATIFAHLKENRPEITVLVITADRDLYSEYRNKGKAFLKPMDLTLLCGEVRAAL